MVSGVIGLRGGCVDGEAGHCCCRCGVGFGRHDDLRSASALG